MDLARFSSFLFVVLGLIVKNHDGAVVFKTCRLEEIAVESALAEDLGKSFSAGIDTVILDCKQLLNSFTIARIIHVKRCFNVEARDMAILSKTVGFKAWIGNAPTELLVSAIPMEEEHVKNQDSVSQFLVVSGCYHGAVGCCLGAIIVLLAALLLVSIAGWHLEGWRLQLFGCFLRLSAGDCAGSENLCSDVLVHMASLK
ncbi:transmembrane protein, putative [Medicago truncatula]|uniref:Transmembrane protein, putative n=1 Tax=Medicago truncatula TaxID=3880 RepID=A0A072V2C6_MEDTR|nr:transmembrane protein, putative [Medicago truncatula]